MLLIDWLIEWLTITFFNFKSGLHVNYFHVRDWIESKSMYNWIQKPMYNRSQKKLGNIPYPYYSLSSISISTWHHRPSPWDMWRSPSSIPDHTWKSLVKKNNLKQNCIPLIYTPFSNDIMIIIGQMRWLIIYLIKNM